ncbi:MAG: sigma-54 interaction domain-containing protein [Bdellovibrionia bacterium]
MINWEELEHIHVIKKLEQILAQWFETDIFFVDEKGQIQNFDLTQADASLKNPLASAFFKKERGRLLFSQCLVEANEKVLKTDQNHLILNGPAGIEKLFISRIVVDKEFLGSVVAYSFIENEMDPKTQAQIQTTMDAFGLEGELFAQAAGKLHTLSESQKKYFFELVDLVAEEIETFHTEITKREERIHSLNNQLGNRYRYDQMIGKSKPMQDLYQVLDKIQNSESTVLIQGENGTGKELIARAIHFNSPRKKAQFVTVNCSAFNENLLDSELFGHVRGAFTGAVKDKKGLFETADHGTLFLDEIGDMQLSMQVKLLRVIQQGTFTPVGGTEQRKVDVRVVAATNKDLKEMIEDGTFREDLYYRINVINLVVPPLRDRKEDMPILIDHFLSKGCQEKNVKLKSFAKRTMEKIFDYPWPGNIRELENEVERLIVLSGEDERIPAELLSPRIRDFGEQSKVQGVRVAGKLKDTLEELEKTMIREGLKRTNWNKSRLAKELGISRAGLIMKVEKYKLDKRKIPRPGSSEEVA